MVEGAAQSATLDVSMLSPPYANEGAALSASAEVTKCPVSMEDGGKSEGPADKSSFQELLGLLQAEYDSVASQSACLQRDIQCLRASLGDDGLSRPGPWCDVPLLPKDPAAPIPTTGMGEGRLLEAKELEVAGVSRRGPAVLKLPASGSSGGQGGLGPEVEQPALSSTPGIIGPEILESWQVKADDSAAMDSFRRGMQWMAMAPLPSEISRQNILPSGRGKTSHTTPTSMVLAVLLDTGKPIGRTCDKFVLSPESRLCMFWDMLGMTFLIVTVLHTPLMVFREPNTTVEFLLELATSVFWTLDICVSFFRGFHRTCIVEMRASEIAKRYLKRMFVPDSVICSLDWAVLVMEKEFSSAMDYSRLSKTVRAARVVRILKLMRLMKLPTMVERMSADLSESAASITSIIKSLLLIVITNHFIACLWYAIGSIAEPAWTEVLDYQERDLWYRYTTSLHWSITQFTPASMEVQPKNSLERTFAVCTIIVGLVMFSTFVSTITGSMSTLRVESRERSKQLEILRHYISENGISVAVSSRISAFIDSYSFSARHCVAKKDIVLLKALPKNLQFMVDWEVYQPILCTQAFFDHCAELEPAAMLQICHDSVEEVTITSCEELFHCTSPARAMYITLSGEMEYFRGFDEVSPKDINGRTHTIISEPALWLSWIHQGRVFALTACDLLRLSSKNLTKVLVSYPELMRAGQEYARLFKIKMQELQFEVAEKSHRCALASDLFVLEQGAGLELVQRAFELAGSEPDGQASPGWSRRLLLVKQSAKQSL